MKPNKNIVICAVIILCSLLVILSTSKMGRGLITAYVDKEETQQKNLIERVDASWACTTFVKPIANINLHIINNKKPVSVSGNTYYAGVIEMNGTFVLSAYNTIYEHSRIVHRWNYGINNRNGFFASFIVTNGDLHVASFEHEDQAHAVPIAKCRRVK